MKKCGPYWGNKKKMKYRDIPILMYHDVSDAGSQWCVSPADFEQQMLLLKKEGYKTISLHELQVGVHHDLETSQKCVVITFDDARSGVYHHAFPILKKLGFTGVMYVVPGWLEGQEIPVQENYAPFLTWEHLNELADYGFEIGSHTFSHRNVARVEAVTLVKELDEAERLIEEKLGRKADHFSYPYGEYTQALRDAITVRYKTAVTVQKGFSKLPGAYARQWVLRNTSLEEFSKLLKKPTLSVCMITKNEEEHLGKALQSVLSVANEIVVVDTGSTDRTKDIAAGFGARVYDFQWNDDFAAARNESLKYATSDWVFILDADEVLGEEDVAAVQEAVSQEGIAGYYVITKNYSNQSSMSGWQPNTLTDTLAHSSKGWFPSLKIRLFRVGKDVQFAGKVHEMIDEKLLISSGRVATLKGFVHHYGSLVETSEGKKRSYLALTQQKLMQDPLNSKAYFELGVQYKELGELELAEKALEKSVELDATASLVPSLNLAVVRQKLQKMEAAQEVYLRILEKDSSHAEAQFGMGFCYFKQGNLDKSVEHFRLAIQSNPQYLEAYGNLGAIYEKQGQLALAEQMLAKAISLDPRNGRAYYNLGVVYEKALALGRAIGCYEKAIELRYVRAGELRDKVEKMKEFVRESKKISS